MSRVVGWLPFQGVSCSAWRCLFFVIIMWGDTRDLALRVMYPAYPIAFPFPAELRRLVSMFVLLHPPFVILKDTVMCTGSDICCVHTSSSRKCCERPSTFAFALIGTLHHGPARAKTIDSAIPRAHGASSCLAPHTDIEFSMYAYLALPGPQIDEHWPLTAPNFTITAMHDISTPPPLPPPKRMRSGRPRA